MLILFLWEGFVLLEGDIFVEIGGAFGAFWNEMEANTTNVLLGSKIFEVVNLLAFNFKFQQTYILQTNLVAIAQMTGNSL